MAECSKTVGVCELGPGQFRGEPIACGKPATWFGYIQRNVLTRRGGVVSYRCDEHKEDLLEPRYRCGEWKEDQ